MPQHGGNLVFDLTGEGVLVVYAVKEVVAAVHLRPIDAEVEEPAAGAPGDRAREGPLAARKARLRQTARGGK